MILFFSKVVRKLALEIQNLSNTTGVGIRPRTMLGHRLQKALVGRVPGAFRVPVIIPVTIAWFQRCAPSFRKQLKEGITLIGVECIDIRQTSPSMGTRNPPDEIAVGREFSVDELMDKPFCSDAIHNGIRFHNR